MLGGRLDGVVELDAGEKGVVGGGEFLCYCHTDNGYKPRAVVNTTAQCFDYCGKGYFLRVSAPSIRGVEFGYLQSTGLSHGIRL